MKVLASNCKRTNSKRSYDQISASQHQLEGAIANLFLGNWPAAITLAGAAEDILPPHEKYRDMMSVLPEVAINHKTKTKDLADIMNEKRNWLKHDKSKDPKAQQQQEFSQEDAVIMIYRALTRFAAHHMPITSNEILSEHIAVFHNWMAMNYNEYLPRSLSEIKS
jgi:hypothetical protein